MVVVLDKISIQKMIGESLSFQQNLYEDLLRKYVTLSFVCMIPKENLYLPTDLKCT